MSSEDVNKQSPEESSTTDGPSQPGQAEPTSANTHIEPSYSPYEDDYGTYDDPYAYNPNASSTAITTLPAEGAVAKGSDAPPPPPPPPAFGSTPEPDEEEEDADDGMLRMSFLEHLEELRKRLILALAGLGIAFVVSLTFCNQLWMIVQAPAAAALKSSGLSGHVARADHPDGAVLHHLGEAADA